MRTLAFLDWGRSVGAGVSRPPARGAAQPPRILGVRGDERAPPIRVEQDPWRGSRRQPLRGGGGCVLRGVQVHHRRIVCPRACLGA